MAAASSRGSFALTSADRGILTELLASARVVDADGNELPLHSNTSREQCEFLRGLIARTDSRSCLEIGLAYGISSLAICDSIFGRAGASFVSIDPYQSAHWRNIGLLNLDRAGFSPIVEFHGRHSHEVLPELLAGGRRLDFAYVDTSKIFDVVMVDAFFLVRLLKVGGVVVFDDCAWPGVKKLVRYLARWPHLEVFATHGPVREATPRRLGSILTKAIPSRDRVFRQELVKTDEEMGISASCVAFRKTAEDSRSWDWSLHP